MRTEANYILSGLLQIALLIVLLPFSPLPVQAATYLVDTTNDTIDINIGDGICADSSGSCSLRAAIQEANFDTASDTITVPAGLYNLTLTGPGDDTGATGDLDIYTDITIIGDSPHTTIIDGQNSDRVFDIYETGSIFTTSFQNLTIQNGSAVDGGGVRISNSMSGAGTGLTIDIDSLIFENNTASGNGGGLFHGTNSRDIINIDDSIVRSNSAVHGGGLFHWGDLIVDSTTIRGNFASGDGGGSYGGIEHTTDSGGSEFTNSAIIGNTAQGIGGGIVSSWNAGFQNLTVTQNTALSGSAFYFGGSEGILGRYLTVANNPVTGVSGAVFDGFGDFFVLQNSVVDETNEICTIDAATGSTTISEATNNIFNGTLCAIDGFVAGNTSADPLLGNLQNNGGATLSIMLQDGSPAIDYITSAPCIATDQRGATRPVDGDNDSNSFCDAGATEFYGDGDLDGLDDFAESEFGSNPSSTDSDGDTINDNIEVSLGLNPSSNDSDSDGQLDNLEYGAPNMGDGNNDGMLDAMQDDVVSIEGLAGNFVTLDADSCGLSDISINEEINLATQDDNYEYPNGLVEFTANCASVDISVLLHGYTEGTLRKYTGLYSTLDAASVSQITIDSNPLIKADYTINDGDELDTSPSGDNMIVDPVGFGVQVAGFDNDNDDTTMDSLIRTGGYSQ